MMCVGNRASAVMLGYITFRNPTAMIAIIEELEDWCRRRGFARGSNFFRQFGNV